MVAQVVEVTVKVVVGVLEHTHCTHSHPGLGGCTHSAWASTRVVDVVLVDVVQVDVGVVFWVGEVVETEVEAVTGVVAEVAGSAVPPDCVMHPDRRSAEAMNPNVRRLKPIVNHYKRGL